MKLPKEAELIRIYISEADKYDGKPLHEVIVQGAREHKMGGVTVLRGLEGFGAMRHLHHAHVLCMSEDLPLVIEIVDASLNVKAFLPHLDEWVNDGLVTVERVRVVLHRFEGDGREKQE